MPNVLPFSVRVRVIRALVEGTSIRATSRITDTDKDVVMRLGVLVGSGCMKLHNRLIGEIPAEFLEVDETWAYVGKHERRKKPTDPASFGDNYTIFAIDKETKLIPSYKTGKRSLPMATEFMDDLRSRIEGTPQISVDGWPHWPESIRRTFGHRGANVGSTVKEYQNACDATATSAGCGRVKSQKRSTVFGTPNQEDISTSIAERSNLTTRMHQRRLTRLTNGYSKKAENLRAALAMHYFWYNFVRVHHTIGTTPAVASGSADHAWTLEEMVQSALEEMGEMNPPIFTKRARRYPRKTHAEVMVEDLRLDLETRPEEP